MKMPALWSSVLALAGTDEVIENILVVETAGTTIPVSIDRLAHISGLRSASTQAPLRECVSTDTVHDRKHGHAESSE
ncbi:hypothetical protein BGZ49_007566, partial [Haplosporangium sp. Z 27]